jgi:hypothetical protein
VIRPHDDRPKTSCRCEMEPACFLPDYALLSVAAVDEIAWG